MFSANTDWRIMISSICTTQRSYDAETKHFDTYLPCERPHEREVKKKEHPIKNPKEDTWPTETKDDFKMESTFHHIL